MKVPAEKRARGELTRLNILMAAETLFAEVGYEAAKLETIAEAVGIKRAAIFYYFESKRELYDELAGDIHQRLIDMTHTRLVGCDDPLDRLFRLVDTWLAFLVDRPTAARLILRNSADVVTEAKWSNQYATDALAILRGIIRDGIASGQFAEVDSMYLVNLLSGSLLQYVCNPEQLGVERSYRPEDPVEVEAFRRVLHTTAKAVLRVR